MASPSPSSTAVSVSVRVLSHSERREFLFQHVPVVCSIMDLKRKLADADQCRGAPSSLDLSSMVLRKDGKEVLDHKQSGNSSARGSALGLDTSTASQKSSGGRMQKEHNTVYDLLYPSQKVFLDQQRGGVDTDLSPTNASRVAPPLEITFHLYRQLNTLPVPLVAEPFAQRPTAPISSSTVTGTGHDAAKQPPLEGGSAGERTSISPLTEECDSVRAHSASVEREAASKSISPPLPAAVSTTGPQRYDEYRYRHDTGSSYSPRQWRRRHISPERDSGDDGYRDVEEARQRDDKESFLRQVSRAVSIASEVELTPTSRQQYRHLDQNSSAGGRTVVVSEPLVLGASPAARQSTGFLDRNSLTPPRGGGPLISPIPFSPTKGPQGMFPLFGDDAEATASIQSHRVSPPRPRIGSTVGAGDSVESPARRRQQPGPSGTASSLMSPAQTPTQRCPSWGLQIDQQIPRMVRGITSPLDHPTRW